MRRRACSAIARLRWLGALAAIFVAACAGTVPAPEDPAAQGGTGLVYHADFLAHDMGPAHPERPDRLRAVVSGLERAGLSVSLAPIAPRMIEDRWITTVHTPAYLASLEAASAKGSVYLGADTMIGPHSLRIARLAAPSHLFGISITALNGLLGRNVDIRHEMQGRFATHVSAKLVQANAILSELDERPVH